MYNKVLSVLALAATVNGVAHDIAVGRNGALRFDPSDITAAVGDTLVFHFYDASGPHDVVSGDFSSPCTPNANAFYSGMFQGDDDGESSFIVPVTSTDPIYFYCSVSRHCQNGMAGAVNARVERNAAAYIQGARSVQRASQPAAPTGGTSTSIDSDDDTTSTTGTTGSTTATSAATAVTTTGTTVSGTRSTSAATGAANTGSTTSTPSATTTPNVAPGRNSEAVVLGGLAAALGGFVAMMA